MNADCFRLPLVWRLSGYLIPDPKGRYLLNGIRHRKEKVQ